MPEPVIVYEVELRAHFVKRNAPLGPVDVELDQWIVLANRPGDPPQQIGYLPKRDGAPLLPINDAKARMGPSLYGALCDAVAQARAAKVGGVANVGE